MSQPTAEATEATTSAGNRALRRIDVPLSSANLEYIEAVLADFVRQPASIEQGWRRAFNAAPFRPSDNGAARVAPSFARRSLFDPSRGRGTRTAPHDPERLTLEHVERLVGNFRLRGHSAAAIDPLGSSRAHPVELEIGSYGFTDADLDRRLPRESAGHFRAGTLGRLLEELRTIYCGSIGVQFMHIEDANVREWVQDHLERPENRVTADKELRCRILRRLAEADALERVLLKKFLGMRSYSLAGAESLIPLLDIAIEDAGSEGVDEIVIGMAHRGRLNVLANIVGQPPRQIFCGLEDADGEKFRGGGDVRYHLGYSGDRATESGREVHLSLCFNPSHLEFVDPVAEGRVRAKQDRFGDLHRSRGMALLIHGDAAFCGEGIAHESLNLSQLPAYDIGGTLHVVLNNQLGFTTPHSQGCSGRYVTDVAIQLQSPIFHVNGDDPEAVAQTVACAMAFRREFRRDVVIDLVCYRRFGHNEGDDPTFTQPIMYQAIESHPTVYELYRDHLVEAGEVGADEASRLAEDCDERLHSEWEAAREKPSQPAPSSLRGVWSGYDGGRDEEDGSVETGVEKQRCAELLLRQADQPSNFRTHRKIQRGMRNRKEMAEEKRPLDWSAAESLALATLATEGHPVRFSGQDSERGTFSQRHAVLHDVEDGETYVPLRHLAEDQARVEIHNSPLCEAAALGFEYGYSLDCPEGLIAWEAQFGDFVNAAQVILDQFLASADDKWNRLSGLVLLLPHGYEGLGPEHSSARLERFLTLAAEDNIQVTWPSTPAQYFHLLRRQVLRRWRKPLVVLTPKSLLRHSACVSTLEELADGSFETVIPDATVEEPGNVQRVLLCSGKLFYELAARRDHDQRQDIAVIRLEQLYPFPSRRLAAALQPYPDKTPLVWVQEEPHNMGAWPFLLRELGEQVAERFPLQGLTRPESASPATGSKSAHKLEQQRLIDAALAED